MAKVETIARLDVNYLDLKLPRCTTPARTNVIVSGLKDEEFRKNNRSSDHSKQSTDGQHVTIFKSLDGDASLIFRLFDLEGRRVVSENKAFETPSKSINIVTLRISSVASVASTKDFESGHTTIAVH